MNSRREDRRCTLARLVARMEGVVDDGARPSRAQGTTGRGAARNHGYVEDAFEIQLREESASAIHGMGGTPHIYKRPR